MDGRKKIILVDEDITSLSMVKDILKPHFDVLTMASCEKMFQALHVFSPDLILLNDSLPDMDIFEAICRLRTSHKTMTLPLILLSASEDHALHERGLALGATDFIIKPYTPQLLIKRIHDHLLLVQQREEIRRYEKFTENAVWQRRNSSLHLQDSLLDTLVSLSENGQNHPVPYKAGEIRRYLAAMTGEMRRRGIYDLELSMWNDDIFTSSAQLHDIGKIIIRDGILQKPGRLTSEEFEAVKNHTILGVKVIENIERNTGKKAFLDHAKIFALAHHERWNGSGYPLGLKEQDIPLQGRLMAIVDVYDALVSERPYKTTVSHETARSIILASQGSHFDPLLTDVFLSVSDVFADIKKKHY